MMNKQPSVSVCMITYNHEKYIREAIEGVLMQQCNVVVELIIANDCSLDATDTIIDDILKKHPKASWIKYTEHKKNIGMMPNFIYALEQCKGKYIALCEGDDYWTDPLKLQKQVDFLEKNEDYNMCFHSVHHLQNEKLTCTFPAKKLPNSFELKDIFSQWFIPTCSMVYKNNIDLPKWFLEIISADFALHFLIAEKGKIYFLKENMGVYRIHNQGVSRYHHGYYKAIGMMRLYSHIDLHFKGKYKELIDKQIEYEINKYVVNPEIDKAVQEVRSNYESKRILRIERKIRKFLKIFK